MVCTLLITIGGYIINDYFDYDIDLINKPNKLQLNKVELILPYFGVTLIGFGLAIYISQLLDKLNYSTIYIIAVLFLFIYASHFKGKGLIGNVLVSTYSSLVIGVLWFTHSKIEGMISDDKQITLLIFMSFIFFSSIAREIIKDCQDIKGDAQYGMETLPIKIGIDKAIFFAIFFLLTLATICTTWILTSNNTNIQKLIFAPALVLIILVSVKTYSARTSADFKFISTLIKVSMAFGLIYLFYLSI